VAGRGVQHVLADHLGVEGDRAVEVGHRQLDAAQARGVGEERAIITIPLFACEVGLARGAIELLKVAMRSRNTVQFRRVEAKAGIKNAEPLVKTNDDPQPAPRCKRFMMRRQKIEQLSKLAGWPTVSMPYGGGRCGRRTIGSCGVRGGAITRNRCRCSNRLGRLRVLRRKFREHGKRCDSVFAIVTISASAIATHAEW
jgi:hypothetical protein